MSKPNKQPSRQYEKRRFVMGDSREDHLTPAERLAEHKASKAHIGPDGGTVRLTLRAKLDNEAPVVRAMYDIANASKSKRRRRRRKDKS